MKLRLPNLALSITMTLWALNFVAIEVVFSAGINLPTMMLTRVSLIWLCLATICLVKKESLVLEKEDRWKGWVFGFINMFVYMYFFLGGVGLTTAAEGAIILATAPLITSIFSAIRGFEKLSSKLVAGLILALVGVGMFEYHPGTPEAKSHILGNLMVLVSSVLWALCAQISRDLVQKYSPLRAFTASTVGAFPALLIFGLIPVIQTPWHLLSFTGWIAFAYLALGAGALGFTLFYTGIHQIGPSRAVRYQYFTPVLTTIFAAILLHNRVSELQILGMFIMIGGLMIAGSVHNEKGLEVVHAVPPCE